MPAFFIAPENIQGRLVVVTGDLLHHLRSSLRTKPGDTLYITENESRRHRVLVTTVDRTQMTAEIQETQERDPRPRPALTLAQAMLKHDPMDWLVQKATELGVAAIQPLLTRHTVVRPDSTRAEVQRGRWQRIAREAAQQSEQWRPPDVLDPLPLERWLAKRDSGADAFALHERSGSPSIAHLTLEPAAMRVTVVIGPEGGWAEEEITLMQRAGVTMLGMGRPILRADTAALAAITLLQSRLGQFD